MIDLNVAETENKKFIAQHFNATLDLLKSKMIRFLPACDNPSGMAAENMKFRFRLVTQNYFRRLHYIALKFSEALNHEDTLMSIIIARTLLETQAHLHHLLSSLIEALEKKNFRKTYKLLAKHAIGRKDGHPSAANIKPVHTADSLKAFDDVYNGNSNDYAIYSEYLHPNSLGHVQLFSDYDEENAKFVFFEKPKKQSTKGFTTACSFCFIREDFAKFEQIETLFDTYWQPPQTPEEVEEWTKW